MISCRPESQRTAYNNIYIWNGTMHTLAVIFGIIANILMALAVLCIIVGLVWIPFPLKNKVYTGAGQTYRYSTPLGGRETGLIILIIGIIGLTTGLLLDRAQVRLIKKFGARR